MVENTYLLLLVFVLSPVKFLLGNGDKAVVNNRPIIGIPTMKITDEVLLKAVSELEDRFYIAASYVKFLEMAGARVVPIPSNFTRQQLQNVVKRVSGLLLPGGETNLEGSRYAKTVSHLLDLAIEANEDGNTFPVMGICRGMQAMLVHAFDDLSILKFTDAKNYTASLYWQPGAKNSTIFENLPGFLYKAAEEENITAHSHKYGVNPKDFDASEKITDRYTILATSVDRKNVNFVSAFEGNFFYFEKLVNCLFFF